LGEVQKELVLEDLFWDVLAYESYVKEVVRDCPYLQKLFLHFLGGVEFQLVIGVEQIEL
jgi:hypothetical protein